MMFLKKRKDSTDPCLRSLLQKAARRGAASVVVASARRLNAIGDRTWLRSRAVVITFEEAWPLAESLVITKDYESKEAALIRVSGITKQKDAAGLGALAYSYHEGDKTMLDLVPSEVALRIIAEGLNRPADFFTWAASQCTLAETRRIVAAAQKYLAAATWGWDKTTIIAAAYLAATSPIPILAPAPPSSSDFPFWVALDKHTPVGKDALQKLSVSNGISYRHLIWAGFYFESAITNALNTSHWFDVERQWRLRKAGLTVESARALWDDVRSPLQSALLTESHHLQSLVEASGASNYIQQGLFI